MEEAEVLCERILIMDKGSFLAAGTLSELNSRHGEGDLIEITFGNEFNISELNLSGIKKLNWLATHTRAQIFVDNIAEVLPAIIGAATTRNVKVEELSSRKMTLDDLFISMTGRHLNE
jgi:ABC-2 type transport system ATP-binding protein